MLNIPEEVKQLFRQGSIRKNIRIHFPNGEREDITNSNLIAESFSFTESICSQDTLKFGLCEASAVEFETFGVGNIKDFTIEIYHEIDISSLSKEFISEYGMTSNDIDFPYYQIPYGVFVVDSCEKQSNLSRRRIMAYQKHFILENVSEAEVTKRRYGKQEFRYDVFKFIVSNFFSGNEDYFPLTEFSRKEIYTTYTYPSSEFFIKLDNGQVEEVKVHMGATCVFFETTEYFDSLFYINDNVVSEEKQNYIRNEVEKIFENWEKKYAPNTYQNKIPDKTRLLQDCVKLLFTSFGGHNDSGNVSRGAKANNGNFIYPYPYVDDYLEISVPVQFVVSLESGVKTYEEIVFDIKYEEDVKAYIVDTSDWLSIGMNANSKGKSKETIKNELEEKSRDIVEAYIELMGVFGNYSRDNKFSFLKIGSRFGIYPSETLYPNNDLFPKGYNQLLTKAMYNHPLWYADNYTLTYSKVVCTYKNTDTEEDTLSEYNIIEVGESEESNYETYDLSDNYLIKNNTFTEDEIMQILESFSSNVEGIRYMPADINLIGLPYLEVGDVVQVITTDGGFETIILNRTLNGIQRLNDNYESRG